MRSRTLVSAFAAAAALASPAAQATCAGFADVEDTSQFCANIAWIKNRAITLGCSPDGTQYCPKQEVTREQMAAFISRLAPMLAPMLYNHTGEFFGYYFLGPSSDPYAIFKWNDEQYFMRLAAAGDPTGRTSFTPKHPSYIYYELPQCGEQGMKWLSVPDYHVGVATNVTMFGWVGSGLRHLLLVGTPVPSGSVAYASYRVWGFADCQASGGMVSDAFSVTDLGPFPNVQLHVEWSTP